MLLVLCSACGEQDPRRAAQAGDYATAARLWQPLAEAGDADAQTALGTLYYLGLGVAKDLTRARRWFEQAARAGHAGAQLHLGVIYRFGHGVPQDIFQAYLWLYAAARQGHERADAYLDSMAGLMLANKQNEAHQLALPYILNPVTPDP